VYIIVKGRIEISKRNINSGEVFRLAILESGDTLGEIALLDEGKRSACARATEPTHVIAININDLRQLASREPEFYPVITQLAKTLTAYLRSTNNNAIKSLEQKIEEYRNRITIGSFLINFVVCMCCCVWAISYDSYFKKMLGLDSVVTDLFLFVCITCFCSLLRNSPYPASIFGLTLKNWKQSSLEAVFYSVLVMYGITFAKLAAMAFLPSFADRLLIEPYGGLILHCSSSLSHQSLWWVTMIAYVFFASPVQEIVTRGCLQSCLQQFFVMKHKELLAILLTNLVFAICHAMNSPYIAMAVFPVGLFWGWLRYKQNSLVGVCLSHSLIGFYGVWVLGLF
jgi:membrane protease YdiL (CAAX protease family)